MTEQKLQEALNWMRSLPPQIRAVMERFPPKCGVSPKIALTHVALEQVVTVYCYRESDAGEITLLVTDGHQNSECKQEWMDLVECRGGVTPELVRAVCCPIWFDPNMKLEIV